MNFHIALRCKKKKKVVTYKGAFFKFIINRELKAPSTRIRKFVKTQIFFYACVHTYPAYFPTVSGNFWKRPSAYFFLTFSEDLDIFSSDKLQASTVYTLQ